MRQSRMTQGTLPVAQPLAFYDALFGRKDNSAVAHARRDAFRSTRFRRRRRVAV